MIRAVPSALDASADPAALLHMMIGSMKTLTQYVTGTAKIQPHAENLWRAAKYNTPTNIWWNDMTLLTEPSVRGTLLKVQV